ncbi:YopX family protein [Bacteroides cellulosilyticus]|uniref:YopX family protein n=1 Tax=Bacteroides cellulosilyticus TaxID=246787 RepID=UPI0022E4591C|nr:YopX family protein [Bacteroides cellulosilyticus]
MGRKIKFRGKRTGNNEWMIDMYTIIQDADGIWLCDASECETVLEKTVNQFTGLRDMNKREIYEDDILKVYIGQGMYELRKVYWWQGSYWIKRVMTHGFYGKELQMLSYYFINEIKVKVIGNIHDNPELINE